VMAERGGGELPFNATMGMIIPSSAAVPLLYAGNGEYPALCAAT
jgi:hypothetical protein